MECFNSLPGEIFNQIVDLADEFPLSWEDAVEVRQELMNERGALENNINDQKENVCLCAASAGIDMKMY